MRTENAVAPKTIYLKDYTPAPYLAQQVNLSFNLLPGKTIVTSIVRYVKNPAGVSDDLVLDGEEQSIVSVAIDGLPFTGYTLADGQMTIANPGKEFSLTIVSEINPEANTALEGLYQSQGTYCTQCEAEGFRRITYCQDRPDVLSVFTVRIEADAEAYPVMLSNGNLQDEGSLPDGRHYRVWHDPFPKPCYLFALVAGDLVRVADTFTTMTGRKVDLHIYVRAGDESQCSHAMASLKKSMQWDEEVYGREYQLELFNIVAVSDFNMGAMENTSLNVFNTALVLAHQETATDSDFMSVEGVIGHEYFHNWTGNRVTCRDWFQLSLKEGFTVFRDQEFSADMNSRAVLRIDDVNGLRRLQFPEDGSPLAHSVQPDQFIEISNFYTKTIYEKGAELIRMQHTLLGAANFRKATDLYFDRFDGQAVTCDDFVQCMAEASGRDMTQFFRWYKQAGTPTLVASSHYDAAQQRYTLSFTQSQPDTPGQTDKQPLHMPIAVGLLAADGTEIVPTQVLEMTERAQSFTFDGIAAKPVPSILRGFSAPVKLETDLSDDDLRLLQVHDTDGFNKWEAGQTLALRTIQRVMADPQADISQFIADVGTLIEQGLGGQGDKALLARALSLPMIGVIGQYLPVIDPAAIDAARTSILTQLKRTHKERLEALYAANRGTGAFEITPQAMGRRALQEAVLDILTVTNGTGCAARAKAHYDAADNMTDRVTALASLTDSTQPERAAAFADFYTRFKAYPLVIDKWFSLQALSKRAQIFDDIAMLRQHPDFNIKNPNRVRSLYTAFAINNPVKFHDPSGQGYAFLRDAIIELNAINPQMAARMVTPLREWKRYAPALQVQMKAALEAVLTTPDLSNDVFEVVSKSLNG
ncbi:aminopeptidase N [Methylophilus aquaticus]|uniref:Aminopeptidase N n=1 Tax=Methylophilus aquaticus TaxID=1971610 RepID=A0ABT9JWK5_9PROT|nr:aminopeptidase N [Methylophilus aquaticus]MDP8568541.1 aminopeptidase N [Methylophilus aquaticus]